MAAATTETPDNSAAKAEFKLSAFDREFKALAKQAEETIRARYGEQIDLGSPRAELVCLNKFMATYRRMKPEEFYGYFESLFKHKREAILVSTKDDRWLRKSKIVLQFGAGANLPPDVLEKVKQVRVMLSDIYDIAYDLKDRAEKLLDGIELRDDAAGDKDLIRPNILLLHVLRIFYHLLDDGADKDVVGMNVTELEASLGVARRTVGQEPWKLVGRSLSGNAAASGGISKIFQLATSAMERFGIKPPEGMRAPTDDEVANVIENVLSNETAVNAAQGLFTSLQGVKDLPTAMQVVTQQITSDPKTIEALQDSIVNTAQFAQMNPPTATPNPEPVNPPTPNPPPSNLE